SGTNAINYYRPTLFKSVGLCGIKVDLLATRIYKVIIVTTYVYFLLFVADFLGRQRSLR
ncbi:hypothetical protein K432DRAFT_309845, partial [Lepidopterella palustris CBS 459.81]